MVKRGFIFQSMVALSILVLFSSQSLAATGSVEDEVKKIVYYAQEYETGNIKFVELLLYESSARQKLNEILGVISHEEGGLLKEEQIKPVLGEPTEETKWVWSEKEQSEKVLSKAIPAWNKIIFDGKQIQIRLEAWPSLFVRDGKEEIIYRLHFSTDFKKPKDSFNIQAEMQKIKGLAEDFGYDQTNDKAESLAKASVNAEKLFESFYRQSGEKCDNLMSKIFGSENKRKDETLFVQQIDFYQGKNFIVNGRLEMCDECDWPWINLDFWMEGRGPGFRNLEEKEFSGEIRKRESDDYYKERITSLVQEFKDSLEKADYNSASSLQVQIRELNNAWNEASNDVRNQVDNQFKGQMESQFNNPGKNQEEYWWIKLEQQKRKLEKEIIKKNYQARKEFYLELFKDYEKKEFYYEQREYERRLVELFTTSGKEICDNNQDDNNNGQIDCSDSQCGGKVCGREKISVQNGNSTQDSYTDLYCMAGTCQMKEDMQEENKTVCGNHVCEAEELESCSRDCSVCQEYGAISCTGKVMFSGENTTNGCPLPPICIEESLSCQADSDCSQPLCGTASCVEDTCKVTALAECKEAECRDGEKKFKECSSGEKLVSSLCEAGKWANINSTCSSSESAEQNETLAEENISQNQTEDIIGNECVVKEDCGNANDVCSNGKCVILPQTIDDEHEEEIQKNEADKQESDQEEVNKGQEEVNNENPIMDETQKQEGNQNTQENNQGNNEKPASPVLDSFIFNIIRVSLTKIGLTGFDIAKTPESAPAQTTPEKPASPEQTTPAPSDNQDTSSPDNSDQQPTSDSSNMNNSGQDSESQQGQEQNNDQERMDRERKDRQKREDDERQDRERREEEERQRREMQCKDDCQRECYNAKIRPCTESCIMGACGGDKLEDCNVDETKVTCEDSCKTKEDINSCTSECNKNCLAGKNFGVKFEEPEFKERKEELGVFKAGGMCRKSESKTESFIFFDGWGKPFQRIQKIKYKYYKGGQGEWCKERLESLKKQRKEFEKGFNEEFVTWFFENYLANSADDWEGHISGIFELYWQDVDISRETVFQMDCLGIDTLSDYNLIEVNYETDYGKIEFWEEVKKVKLPGMNGEVEVITPYMKTWVFPPRDFLAYEMKKSMEKREFPGPPEEKAERKNEEGPTEQEKEIIKKDRKFMNNIRELSEKYGGSVDVAVQLKDRKKDEIVFNIYVKIDEENIIKMEPMLPSEMPEHDMEIGIDFDKVYDLIHSSEKDMQGEHIESPPWSSRKFKPVQKIKEIVNGVKMWFKLRSMLNSAEYSPKESEKDAQTLINAFLPKIMEGDDYSKEKEMNREQENNKENSQEGIWDSKEKITGEIISD